MANDDWKKNWYLGIDLGTASVGWAVTDAQYNIPRLRGKRLWGVRLFEEAKTAATRRSFRTSRRRKSRRNERKKYLNEIFAAEINEIDPEFFARLKDSFFYAEDKKINKGKDKKDKNTLFNDEKFNDKDYHKRFPTIWHLRNYLLTTEDKDIDIRFFYLAILHIIKNRGHFLYGGDFEATPNFAEIWEEYREKGASLGIVFNENANKTVEEIVNDQNKTKNDKKKELRGIIDTDENKYAGSLDLLAGSDISDIGKIFRNVSEDEDDDAVDAGEKTKLSYSKGFEEQILDVHAKFGEEIAAFLMAGKKIYDYGVLHDIMDGETSLSAAFVKLFDKHKNDAKRLRKALVVASQSKEFVRDFFNEAILKEDKLAATYYSYAKGARNEKEKLYNEIKKLLKNATDEESAKILEECENGKFMPVLKGNFGGVVPNQLHKNELNKIVGKLVKNYPSFAEKDADGYTGEQKINSLITYRIPYYVGPLNPESERAWLTLDMKRGKVYPWNFDEMIAKDKAARAFIDNLIGKCTYLHDKDVLPKQSLLYQKYLVLNVLNKTKIDGEPIDVDLKHRLYNEVFLKNKGKVTQKKIKDFLKSENIPEKEVSIGDANDDAGRKVEAELSSWIKFREIFGDTFLESQTNYALAEETIKTITALPDDRVMLERKLSELFKTVGVSITEEQIKKLAKMNCVGWAKFSRELLEDIKAEVEVSANDKRELSIIEVLWETNYNFMELLYRYKFKDKIDEYNAQNTETCYKTLIEKSYASPPVKRTLNQAFKIVRELIRAIGTEPAKIFIETTRDDEQDPKRKDSRYTQLKNLYKKISGDNDAVIQEAEVKDIKRKLSSYEDNQGALKSKAIYLYFTQMGRCPYCGKAINIAEIGNRNLYDIDHIIPQSLKKDDSLINNQVLAHKQCNAKKTDKYPIPDGMRQVKLYKLWLDNKLISKVKHDRLMRPESRSLTDDERAEFIARQLVETSQAAKIFKDMLGLVYKDKIEKGKFKIVTNKARLVSDFRHDKELLKVRELNDFHHAKDAYLNVVVGNVYNTKFTDNPRNFFAAKDKSNESEKFKYHMAKLFDYKVADMQGEVVWDGKNGEFEKTVKATMARNDVLWTRMCFEKTSHNNAGFYNQMPISSGAIPLKASDERLKNTERYGGYTSLTPAYVMLIEDAKGKRKFVPMPILYKNKVQDYLSAEEPNSKILIEKIPMNALIKINGYPVHITGCTDNGLEVISAVQLLLPEHETELKKIMKFASEKNADNARAEKLKITKEKNQEIFALLIKKKQSGIFKKRPRTIDFTEENKQRFAEISLADQARTLANIIEIFQCNAARKRLEAIGISAEQGRMSSIKLPQQGKDEKIEPPKLISQSITGLFEEEISLWQVGSE